MPNDRITVQYHFVRQQKSLDRKQNGVLWALIKIETLFLNVRDNPTAIKLKFYEKEDIELNFLMLIARFT